MLLYSSYRRLLLDTAAHIADLACLAYKGDDRPQKRKQAATLLAANPALPAQDVFVAAACADVVALAAHIAADPARAFTAGGPRNWQPLLYLCYARIPGGDPVAALDLLLASGADPCAHFVAWGSPFTAITGAVGHGEQGDLRLPEHPNAVELVSRLLAAGADPNDSQALYNTMLGDDNSWLRFFLDHGLQACHTIRWPVEGGARTVDFVLANAVDCGRTERVTLLLHHGASATCLNTYNGLPVHTSAVLAGHDAIAALLVQAGAVPAPLTVAQRLTRALTLGATQEVAAALASSPELIDDSAYLINAAERGSCQMVHTLLNAGADINRTDKHGVTALHRAAFSNRADVVTLLLAQGADATLVDANYGATALGWARHGGSNEAADVLERSAL